MPACLESMDSSCFQNGRAGISNQAGHTIPCETDLGIIAFGSDPRWRITVLRLRCPTVIFPTFKLKEKAELSVKDHYVKLNTEGYGSILCTTWMDRPLSLAGRAILRDKDGFREALVKIDRDLVLIPSVAIT